MEWYTQQDPEHFLFHTGERVTSLDTVAHSVTTSKGRNISYDYCVLATGSESTLPPYVSPVRAERAQGIFVYRNISDLDKILSYSEQEHVRGGRVRIIQPKTYLRAELIFFTHSGCCRWRRSHRTRGCESSV